MLKRRSNTNGARTGRTRARGNRMASNAMLKTQLNGRSLKGRTDPPTYQSTPWNTLVVGIRYPGTAGNGRATLTVPGLIADIEAQLGLATVTELPNMQVRIQTLQFWAQNKDVATPTVFNADIYDIVYGVGTDNNARILSSLTDVGAKNHYAKSSYIYPKTQQNLPLTQGTASYIYGCDLPPDTTLIVYVRCLWRFQPPTTTAPDLERFLLTESPSPMESLPSTSSSLSWADVDLEESISELVL